MTIEIEPKHMERKLINSQDQEDAGRFNLPSWTAWSKFGGKNDAGNKLCVAE